MDARLRKALFPILLPAYAGLGLVRGQNNDVVGCLTVGCPETSTCTIANETFSTGIGLAPIVSDNTSFPSLSWVKGSYIDNSGGSSTATFVDDFYLATPEGLSLGSNDTKACAVFFRQVNAAYDSDTDAALATGTCSDAIEQTCIDALTKRATDLDVSDESDPCGALLQAFESNLDIECSKYAYGDKWQSLSSQSLTSPQPITGKENSTSNCWPILPRTDNLALIGKFTNTSNWDANNTEANAHELTPVLSVFYPGSGSVVSSTQAQLTCLKVVGESTDLSTMSTGVAPQVVATSFTKLFAVTAGVAVASRLLLL